jgi:hypothetical protein
MKFRVWPLTKKMNMSSGGKSEGVIRKWGTQYAQHRMPIVISPGLQHTSTWYAGSPPGLKSLEGEENREFNVMRNTINKEHH